MTMRAVQRGFAAIAAIFLIVVLATLGVYMASLSSSQQISSGQDVQGIRAYWAARSGLEWGLASVSATVGAPPFACPAASTTLTLDGFTVVVTCNALVYTEAAISPQIFQLQSVAKFGSIGTPFYIERSVSASMEK